MPEALSDLDRAIGRAVADELGVGFGFQVVGGFSVGHIGVEDEWFCLRVYPVSKDSRAKPFAFPIRA